MRGSCHQCGSVSSPSPARIVLTESISVTCVRVAAGAVDHLVEPLVEVARRSGTRRRLRRARRRRWGAARSRAGRRSAAGCRPPRRGSRPRSRTRSATWVVVATASTSRVAPRAVVAAAGDARRAAATTSERRERRTDGAGYTSENDSQLTPSRRRSQLAHAQDCAAGWTPSSWSPSASGASSSPSPAARVGLVLGNIRLPAVLLVASSPAAGAGANIGISGVAAFAAAVAHIRAGRINWRLFAWMAPPSMAGAVVGRADLGRDPRHGAAARDRRDAALLRRRPAARAGRAARAERRRATRSTSAPRWCPAR